MLVNPYRSLDLLFSIAAGQPLPSSLGASVAPPLPTASLPVPCLLFSARCWLPFLPPQSQPKPSSTLPSSYASSPRLAVAANRQPHYYPLIHPFYLVDPIACHRYHPPTIAAQSRSYLLQGGARKWRLPATHLPRGLLPAANTATSCRGARPLAGRLLTAKGNRRLRRGSSNDRVVRVKEG
ncbi:hypothetical protein BHM03_00057739 [Ensete ventricosum]|nr:hypothetical protein BHM03_00057739 [Ensete ventricosum]